MSFRFKEARTSRSSTHSPPSETRRYTAAGSSLGTYVRTFALGATPAFVAHERGTLFRQDIKVEPAGYQLWTIECPYGPKKAENGQMNVSFDTTGGTIHITAGKSEVGFARAGEVAPPMKNSIGVRGDQIDGADQVVPALKITVGFKHPAGIITMAQIKNLARWTGMVNSDNFMTFAPGEVLFLGASGSEGTDAETQLQYQFACSQNVDGLTIGDVVGIAKKGHDVAWTSFVDKPEEVGGKRLPTKQPRFVYVNRVYDELAMAAALGFGG